MEIYSIFQDEREQRDYYVWRINGSYLLDGNILPQACIDSPLAVCFVNERNIVGVESAIDDRFFNGQQVTRLVGFLEDDGFRFSNPQLPNFMEILQFSISREAYDFYNRIKILKEINGEIFDAPPLSLGGNMYHLADPDKPIIGFFGAFSVSQQATVVESSILRFIQQFPGACGSCDGSAGSPNGPG